MDTEERVRNVKELIWLFPDSSSEQYLNYCQQYGFSTIEHFEFAANTLQHEEYISSCCSGKHFD